MATGRGGTREVYYLAAWTKGLATRPCLFGEVGPRGPLWFVGVPGLLGSFDSVLRMGCFCSQGYMQNQTHESISVLPLPQGRFPF